MRKGRGEEKGVRDSVACWLGGGEGREEGK